MRKTLLNSEFTARKKDFLQWVRSILNCLLALNHTPR